MPPYITCVLCILSHYSTIYSTKTNYSTKTTNRDENCFKLHAAIQKELHTKKNHTSIRRLITPDFLFSE